MKQILNFIDGEFRASSKTFVNISPVTGQTIAMVHEADQNQVNQAVMAARQALNGEWRKLQVSERVELLYALADGVNQRFDDFLQAECADTGKPESFARAIDIPRGAANFKIFADIIKNIPTEFFQLDTPDAAGAINYGLRSPVGVVAAICPWNLPLLLMTWKVGPALACGNTVVVKPSEETPHTATLLGEVMKKVGIPAGVYNVVHGFGPGSAGELLTQHPQVNAITFTGETVTGEVIMRTAAKGARPVSLEMGGKNAAIIFADCDLDKAIAGTLRSAFANSGQVCLGTERVYVERPIFKDFLQRLKQGAELLKMGVSEDKKTTMGPLISKQHQRKVLGYYQLALEEGATLVTGGGIPKLDGDLRSGSWVEPTIWIGLDEDSRVMKEEIFGPCCHLSPFDDEDEVLAKVNDNEYGLACAIWSQDVSRAHRLAHSIEVGIVWVNSWYLRDLRTPFGGAKKSGIGREGGIHSLEFYTEMKNVCVKL